MMVDMFKDPAMRQNLVQVMSNPDMRPVVVDMMADPAMKDTLKAIVQDPKVRPTVQEAMNMKP